MCGIAGAAAFGGDESSTAATVAGMVASIRHRGPDDDGTWHSPDRSVAFGHARLSILDLSMEGHQPMHSNSGRYVIVYNGEVYNYQELNDLLMTKGHRFRGHSDTETLLAAFEEWGVEESLHRFNGMYAWAVWDNREEQLFLCRDRIGVKPLYYGWLPHGGFAFCSELKGIVAAAQEKLDVNRDALCSYMRHGYIPAPESIYQGIFKLPAATVARFAKRDLHKRPSDFSPDVQMTGEAPLPTGRYLSRYWRAEQVAVRGMTDPLTNEQDALDGLESLLRDAIKLRMISDVPLGAFLSGGIDSTVVVSLMQQLSNRPIKTFTIGFKEDSYNEAHYAKRIAEYLGTDHTELYVEEAQALEVVPLLGEMYDEPFADPSQIPTYLVNKLARSSVTVALSGDGGDELFGGYERYRWGERLWSILKLVPSPMALPLARTIQMLRTEQWDKVYACLLPLIPRRLRVTLPGNKLYKLSTLFQTPDQDHLYHLIVSQWEEAGRLVYNSSEARVRGLPPEMTRAGASLLQQMMYTDLVTYLPDDIFVKVDRASMAVSLEAREPLVDYRVVEWAWRMPDSMRINNGVSKWPLRQIVQKYVPSSLLERPKMGFGVPVGPWLRGRLRDWADDLLSEERLKKSGYLDPALVRSKWDQHRSGQANWAYHLWNVLMFESWLDHR